jgi:hypothetical protein
MAADFIAWGIAFVYKWACSRKNGIWYEGTIAIRLMMYNPPFLISRGIGCR